MWSSLQGVQSNALMGYDQYPGGVPPGSISIDPFSVKPNREVDRYVLREQRFQQQQKERKKQEQLARELQEAQEKRRQALSRLDTKSDLSSILGKRQKPEDATEGNNHAKTASASSSVAIPPPKEDVKDTDASTSKVRDPASMGLKLKISIPTAVRAQASGLGARPKASARQIARLASEQGGRQLDEKQQEEFDRMQQEAKRRLAEGFKPEDLYRRYLGGVVPEEDASPDDVQRRFSKHTSKSCSREKSGKRDKGVTADPPEEKDDDEHSDSSEESPDVSRKRAEQAEAEAKRGAILKQRDLRQKAKEWRRKRAEEQQRKNESEDEDDDDEDEDRRRSKRKDKKEKERKVKSSKKRRRRSSSSSSSSEDSQSTSGRVVSEEPTRTAKKKAEDPKHVAALPLPEKKIRFSGIMSDADLEKKIKDAETAAKKQAPLMTEAEVLAKMRRGKKST
eukprot:TRINITY_DN20596_c0_g1_i1.p1 TRINITY_DN20596_c0_g1~~TRINITY_DN20596_c0_g1_i1.p1  ORF type:complete len:451 (-),score=137.66 TRINITY_DN20596_c0_g1_i1:237-1589(-)